MPYTKKSIDRPWMPKKTNVRQDKATNKIYHTARWMKTRKMILELEPLCRECKSNGIIKEATVVDHIVRIRSGGDPFDISNLQPLCDKCHASKSGRESHGL